jgi:hypothetical protein
VETHIWGERSRLLIRLYLRPGGRLYELGAIVAISSGINIVTSSVTGKSDRLIVICGVLFSISGMLLFLISARVSSYHGRARDRRLRGGTRTVKEHLESIVFEQTKVAKLWREFVGVMISGIMIVVALLLVGWVVSGQPTTANGISPVQAKAVARPKGPGHPLPRPAGSSFPSGASGSPPPRSRGIGIRPSGTKSSLQRPAQGSTSP